MLSTSKAHLWHAHEACLAVLPFVDGPRPLGEESSSAGTLAPRNHVRVLLTAPKFRGEE